jgi:hypothetical protein
MLRKIIGHFLTDLTPQVQSQLQTIFWFIAQMSPGKASHWLMNNKSLVHEILKAPAI